jgi:uncharacterized protein YndB with AHSA1/START domain
MNGPSVAHATFVIERDYPVPPARVFAALADPAAKAKWFIGPEGWTQKERAMDFRVGGRERVVGSFSSGLTSAFDCTYLDIIRDRRIAYSYVMHINENKISASLATVEFTPTAAGTKLTFTEQGAFLDGYDDAGKREHGTGGLLDKLGAFLQREVANA